MLGRLDGESVLDTVGDIVVSDPPRYEIAVLVTQLKSRRGRKGAVFCIHDG